MPRKRGRKGINATGRTKGDGQFLAIPYLMAHSEAFRSLSGPALKVWIELRTQFNGHNNGQGYGRLASEYTLTDVPYCGHPASRDWQKWRAESKNKTSVPSRHRHRRSGPSEYRQNETSCRSGTRRGGFKVIDGSG